MGRKQKDKKRKRRERTAATSDPYRLYELSVQEPEAECDVIDQFWTELRGRRPRTIREDFCATAITAIEWVARNPRHRAIGVDIDPAVLAQARKRVHRRLEPRERSRLQLLEDNVITVETPPVDSVLATNFSYFVFKTRALMKRYFRNAHRALVDDGLFVLDAYGGSDSFLEMEEDRDVDGFKYVWDQHHYNPVTGDVINYIHFRFPDGTKLERAFTYEWRLWTLPELRELLIEAGFKDVTIYWEGSDEDGEGNGEWSVTKTGEACAGWIAYIVAGK